MSDPTRESLRRWYPLVLILAAAALSAAVYSRLPDRVPIHWNRQGIIDGYGPRALGVFLMPLVMAGMWVLMRALPKIDPRRANYARMQGAYDLVVNATMTVMAIIHAMIIAAMLGARVPMPRLMPAVIGVLLVVVGNVLPRARPNWFFGIRTPWTLSNDRVWERTHRVGGYLMVAAGFVAIALAAAPLDIGGPGIGVVAAIAAIGSVAYSYVAWRQETSRGVTPK